MADAAESKPNGVPAAEGAPKGGNADIDPATAAAYGIGAVVAISTVAALWRSKKGKKKEVEGTPVAVSNPEAVAEPVIAETEAKVEKRFGLFGKGRHSPAPSKRSVVVQPGDTLWGLSTTYKVPIDVIKTSNSILGDMIFTGQELVIPGEGLLK